MANWYGAARSNHVKIKDMEGLKVALEPFPIAIHTSITGENEGKTCFLSEDVDNGCWPSYALDDNDDEIEFDASALICPFMEDDQILVMMEAGAEKLRYITGYAIAYDSDGNMTSLNLNEIYERAAKCFGVPQEQITDASY